MIESTTWQTIAEIPWWLYPIASYILWIIYAASKPRDLTMQSLYLLPCLFIGLSMLCMGAALDKVTPTIFSIWGGLVVFGTGLSYLHFSFIKVKAYKNQKLLYFPGTFLPFIGLIFGIISRFVFHYSVDYHKLDPSNPANMINILIFYGFLTGVFIGRLGYAIRSQNEGPYVESAG